MATTPQPPEHAAYNAANPDNDYIALRAGMRREKIAARMALLAEEHLRLSALLEGHLEREFARHEPGVVAFCSPIRGEFDARPLIGRLIERGWRAAMPVALVPDMPMPFRCWTLQTVMATDSFGIPIPAHDAISVPPQVVLLPVVAFDKQGYRLGYGGGYFDRTLAGLAPRPMTIGVGFELARVAGIHPQAHDIPLDAVATEAGIRKFDRHG